MQATSRMSAGPVEVLESGIAVGMHPAAESGELVLRVPAPFGRRENRYHAAGGAGRPRGAHRGHRSKAGRSWVLPVPGAEHAYRRVVGEDRLGRLSTCRPMASASGSSSAVDLPTQSARWSGPGRARRARKSALPIERQMVGVFADQHMGEQPRAGTTALDGARRQRRSHDAFTASAHHPRFGNSGYHDPARDIVQLFGDILAELLEPAAQQAQASPVYSTVSWRAR